MVESRVVGYQDDEKYGVIMRCIQTCDGEWLDLPEDVSDGGWGLGGNRIQWWWVVTLMGDFGGECGGEESSRKDPENY